VSTAHRGPDICRNIFWMRPLQCGGRWALPRCVGRWPRKANIKWRIAQPFSTAPGAGAETHRVACGSSGFVTVEYVVFSFQSISRVRVPKKRGVGSRVLSTFCRRAGYWQFNLELCNRACSSRSSVACRIGGEAHCYSPLLSFTVSNVSESNAIFLALVEDCQFIHFLDWIRCWRSKW